VLDPCQHWAPLDEGWAVMSICPSWPQEGECDPPGTAEGSAAQGCPLQIPSVSGKCPGPGEESRHPKSTPRLFLKTEETLGRCLGSVQKSSE
jgi:hypothetical protein